MASLCNTSIPFEPILKLHGRGLEDSKEKTNSSPKNKHTGIKNSTDGEPSNQ